MKEFEMRVSRWIPATISLALILLPAGSGARAIRPPDIVGPPQYSSAAPCSTRFTEFGGSSAGTQIPIPALRLGEPIRRATTSFTTGGSGTANAYEMERRRKAGLPYEPVMFDTSSSDLPLVYAEEAANAYLYERLPLKTLSKAYDPYGLIFAQPVSPTAGRIASLQLTMAKAPSALPRVRALFGQPSPGGCRDRTVDIYAPAMTARQVRDLFSHSQCNWWQLATCTESQLPRGRVLFVALGDGPARYTYRWVDYDLLAGTRFGKSSR
ncbi:MAG: hypothetical protein ABI471_04230 [Sphingomonas bacterium]